MSVILIGQRYISAAQISMGGTPRTPTAGYRYLMGYQGESAAGVIEHLEALLFLEYPAASVTLDTATGICTIAFGETGGLIWGTSEFKAVLGFESDIGSSAGASGTLPCQGWWAADREPSYYPLDASLVWDTETTTKTVRSTDGSAFTVVGSTHGGKASISFGMQSTATVVDGGTTADLSLERFWKHVAVNGLPLRYVSTSYTLTNHVQGLWELSNDRSAFTDFARRTIESYDGLWDCTIPLIRYEV